MTYEAALEYICDVPKFTRKTSLAHTERLLELLEHPEAGQRVLHVAGTNGKGSVCADLEAMLRAAEFRTGLFTSPHLVRINERFRIDGQEVSDAAFLAAFRKVMAATARIQAEGEPHPTYFEILFLMGMLLFRDAGVDYTILEVGMGGRLDATNVIRPLVSVITSVGLDHTMYLGETVPEIAREKAGIIKPGIPVVYDAGRPEVSAVIEETARKNKSRTRPLLPERIRREALTNDGIRFRFLEDDGTETPLQIAQIAPYQMRNAALAWYTLRTVWAAEGQKKDVLQDRDVSSGFPEEAFRRGLAGALWPCRMQRIAPDVYIDGAHNPDGIACFLEAAEMIRGQKTITLLFSAVCDKHYAAMVRALSRFRPAYVVTTRIRDKRAVSEEELEELFLREGCPAVFSECVPARAYALARALQDDGILFCVGSLYLAGELLQAAGEEDK